MTPFSLLPSWFQRRYRVWRGCGKGEHRDVIVARSDVGARWACVDCARYVEVGEYGIDPYRKARRDA